MDDCDAYSYSIHAAVQQQQQYVRRTAIMLQLL